MATPMSVSLTPLRRRTAARQAAYLGYGVVKSPFSLALSSYPARLASWKPPAARLAAAANMWCLNDCAVQLSSSRAVLTIQLSCCTTI